jgi:hypothetical protein
LRRFCLCKLLPEPHYPAVEVMSRYRSKTGLGKIMKAMKMNLYNIFKSSLTLSEINSSMDNDSISIEM